MAVVVGNTLHANVAAISDFDNLWTRRQRHRGHDVPASVHYQWQYVDAVSGNWIDYAGATSADFVVPNFLLTQGSGCG